MADDRLLNRITAFLDANYPCRCDDPECPGNYWEALEIVDMVREHLRRAVGGSWVEPSGR